jgi:sugar/nucleoside kinase (ribokinase family)
MPPVSETFDIVLIGSYTKDTIVSAAGTRVVDGGGFNYGACAAALLGLKVAAVTRLAREDAHVVQGLERLGVRVFTRFTPDSTHLRLDYPTSDVDRRTITVTRSAGSFTPADLEGLEARAFTVNASMRGEVGIEVLQALRRTGALIVADAQGFVRVRDAAGMLAFAEWPEKREVLALVNILKADAVEAEALTGQRDLKAAARLLRDLGPQEIVLTHKDGLLVHAQGSFYEAPFLPEKLVGRSGRGDTCIASYVARRLDAPPAQAAVWAAAATSLKLEAEGPIIRTAREIEDLIGRKYRGHA